MKRDHKFRLVHDRETMVPLLSQAAGAGGAFLSSTHYRSIKSVHPNPPLFSKRRPEFSVSRRLKPLTLANAADSSGGASTKPTSSSSSTIPFDDQGSTSSSISFVGQEDVSLEGVIQFEKPNSTPLLAKWGYVHNFRLPFSFRVILFN